MTNKLLFFILIAFALTACENNIYQVSELKGATEDISSGELPPNFNYPKNKLYIDGLKIRIAPCIEHDDDRCSAALVGELLISSSNYFDSTYAYAKTIFPVTSEGNVRLENNYMALYASARKLAARKDTKLNLKPGQTEVLDKAYAKWEKK